MLFESYGQYDTGARLHADLKLLRYFYGVPTYNSRRIMRSKASEISIRHAEPKEIAFVDIKNRKS